MRNHHVHRVLAAAGAALLVVGGMLVATVPAAAAPLTFIVSSNADTGPDTLRQAIIDANLNADADPDLIEFDFAGPETITLLSLLPAITGPLVIQGPGSAALTVLGSTDGPVLEFSGAVTVQLSGLTLASSAVVAAGIESTGADVVLVDVVASGFTGIGIDVSDGALDAQRVVADDNGDVGISFYGSDASDNLTLNDVAADGTLGNGSFGSGNGIAAFLTAGRATLDNVRAADNTGTGIELALIGGFLTANLLHAHSNDYGIVIDVNDAVVELRDSEATGNDLGIQLSGDNGSVLEAFNSHASANGGGWQLQSGPASRVTVSGSTATANLDDGIFVLSAEGVVEVLSSRSSDNGSDPCGCGGSGIFALLYGGSMTVDDTVLSGNAATVGGGLNVAGLLNAGALTISNSTITGNSALEDSANSAGGYGGGIAVGDPLFPGYFEDGTTMAIVDTKIEGNNADFDGGGVYLGGIGLNPIAPGDSTGPITFLRSTIAGNTAEYGGGVMIDDFGFETNEEPLVLFDSSTISGNSATEEGGGLYLYKSDTAGPGMGVVELLSSTISGNSATTGAGLVIDSQDADTLVTRVRHSTIADNTATAGAGGVLTYGSVQTLLLDHALLGGNGVDLEESHPLDTFDARYSLVQNSVTALPPGQGNIVGADPQLGPLAANGGPTLTHALLDGSPAFNKGDPAFAAPPSLDQRGEPRVFQVIDIGAVEKRFTHPATGRTSAPAAGVGALLVLAGIPLLAGSRLRRRRPGH